MIPVLLMMIALASAANAEEADATILSIVTAEPRAFGYFVGDVLRREVEIVVAEPYRLEKASEPVPGRLNYWLDLRAVKVAETEAEGRRRYRITLDYQSFYVPLSPATLTIPAMLLVFFGRGESTKAEIPAFSFVMAPLREVQPEKPEEGPAGYLQPDAVPHATSTLTPRIAFAAAMSGALLALLLLAYHEGWWPFRARPDRPFTRAARAINRRIAHDAGLDGYKPGLLDLHRAFDAAAGHRLLAEDVPDFLIVHREFQPLAEDISRFFATSRQAFFGNDVIGASKAMSFDAVAKLGARLGEAERKAA